MIREHLADGSCCPQPVRRVMIPKPGGGERPLGIPSVTDRLIRQAIAQVLTPIFDPGFSESSFGLRREELPQRRALCSGDTTKTFEHLFGGDRLSSIGLGDRFQELRLKFR